MDGRVRGTVALALAAVTVGTCAACSGSSSGPSTSASASAPGGSASAAASAPPAGSSGGIPSFGSDQASTPFCKDLTGTALSDVTSGNSDVVKVWDELATDAPPAVRADVRRIDQYVDVAFKGGTQKSPGDAAKLSGAITDLTTWAAEHCGLGG